MNVEFLAITVGLGVAIVLLAVVAELMMLRSSVDESATAVKDLLADAQEHEIAAGIEASGDAGSASTVIADAAAPSFQSAVAQPSERGMAASPQPAATPEMPSGPSAANGSSGVKAGAKSEAPTEEERAARRAQRLERRKLSAANKSAASAELETDAVGGRRGKGVAVPRKQRLLAMNGQAKEIHQRSNESDEEFAARSARRQARLERLKQASEDAAQPKVARQRANERDEEDAARSARRQARLERRKQVSEDAAQPKVIHQRANESDEDFAARQERVLQRFKRRQSREPSAE